jgi:1-acyl-sn-glycerol-3-phosphate acyltransferase
MSTFTSPLKKLPTHLAGPAPFLAAFALCVWIIWNVITSVHAPQDVKPHREHIEWGLFGAGIGLVLCLIFAHPTRILGFVAYGALLWIILLPIDGPYPWCRTLAFLAGFAAALILLPLALTAWRRLGATKRYKPKLTPNDIVMALVILAIFGGCLFLQYGMGLTPRTHFWLWWGLQVVGMLTAFFVLRRAAFEWLSAALMMPMYRMRTLGPGLEKVPWEGPLLIVANHAAWMDPFWIGKVIPRPHTPMMTSVFYDLPVVRTIMKHVLGVIRVPFQLGRRETPEINAAIARLDQGGAVLIFPEGGLRRKEEQILKLFGQGVWRILKERPDTPVVCCWIEGNWGSFFSARNGEPCKNKKFDWLRPITIVIADPKPVPSDILATQQATRRYLMDQVLALRQHLPGYKPEGKPTMPVEAPTDEGPA